LSRLPLFLERRVAEEGARLNVEGAVPPEGLQRRESVCLREDSDEVGDEEVPRLVGRNAVPVLGAEGPPRGVEEEGAHTTARRDLVCHDTKGDGRGGSDELAEAPVLAVSQRPDAGRKREREPVADLV